MKRFLQFRLRTFLVIVTLLAIWMGVHQRRTIAQRNAVAAITEYGVWVRYDHQVVDGMFQDRPSPVPEWLTKQLGIDFFHDVVEINLVYSEDSGKRADNDRTTEAPLHVLSGTPRVRKLYTSDGQTTDENIRHVSQLANLETFFVWDATSLTDAGVVHLSDLDELTVIHISKSSISDKSLEVLAKLPKIEHLSLQFNDFTRDGMRYLADAPNLTNLWICGKETKGNNIDDKSLQFVLDRPKLVTLGIQNSQVTSEFVSRLESRTPTCRVID